MRYSHPPLLNPVIRVEKSIFSWSIGKFLVFIGMLLMGAILTTMVILVYKIVAEYLDQAYSRNAQLRAMAQAHEINQLLVSARYELDFLSRLPLTQETMMHHWEDTAPLVRNRYREIAFQGLAADEHFVLLNTGTEVVNVPIDQAMGGKFGIFLSQSNMSGRQPGQVQISDPLEVVYTSVPVHGATNAFNIYVIRLTTGVYGENNQYKGQLTLSVDLLSLRDIISLHTSNHSPLFLYPQESEQKKTFFFDSAGWLLFQSESPDHPKEELSVDQLRMGVPGDVGRPGFTTAFRPGSGHDRYWAMVADVQGGKTGQFLVSRPFLVPTSGDRTLYLSYVPITFFESPDTQRIVGGIGCVDASFVFMASTYRIAGTLAVCLLVALVLVFLSMYFVGSCFRRQLLQLRDAVEARVGSDDAPPLTLEPLFNEINLFQRAINILLTQLRIARSDSLLHEGFLEDDRARQPVDLDKEIRMNPLLDARLLASPLHGIIGGSKATHNLRQQIHKASRVLADVLIVGETGTGKELTAEAIHLVSHRVQGPFISINCGALDENLLMDALFGHVKGAFTEAHSDRKGAFVAASGGTLHLDEIGNASPRVQQVLLRALSVRRIRPLGSDKDIAFDVRIVAATNVDLLNLAVAGSFREDLYYRLAVIAINTPPLRDRKEDIPVLAKAFLEENASATGSKPVHVSRGALEKLMRYDWPGNIRELRNCITRSLAFAEGDLLLAEHILFDERTADGVEDDEPVLALGPVLPALPQPALPASQPAAFPDGATADALDEEVARLLNLRQRKAWPVIVRGGMITRSEYQAVVGEAISVRTAQYDLHDLVAKGLLRKFGRGPSSRYLVSRS
ncbi:MAG: sigma 54-interacting transcriptional regulator [Desulfobulbus sp.]|jgi:DNA-binding NtrC family response regulator|uniref:sigma 54-interacting transcriptional regulator n=1 Tax=Desulfobulbus sp. TaxID=895 RepID=UPI00283DCD3C|nr:sigma 54-interacting transcriptional regulator [Desulfobulbus sp.]MDR2551131.1 sigma 54-interacting transcriptional regulator [Desulfobulbus sp.]